MYIVRVRRKKIPSYPFQKLTMTNISVKEISKEGNNTVLKLFKDLSMKLKQLR